ncbi:MAG: DUF6443 domain-containing protein, partial [Bacteroidales bacterium]|nr:DUF6443 domain-containing protein [Bacteroidales bacterium]
MKTINQFNRYIYRIAFVLVTCVLCQTADAQSVYFEIWMGTACSGKPATIEVEFGAYTNNDTPVTYYFYKNGNQQSSVNSTQYYFSYQISDVYQGDQIRCEVVTRAGNRYVSNTITVQISQPVTPYVHINTNSEWDDYTNQPVFCPGSSRTMTASGNGYSYEWYRNGARVGTSSSYTPETLNNGDIIRVENRVYNYCNSSYRTASDELTVQVRQNVTPAVTLTSNAATTICQGTSVKFTTSVTGVQYPNYTWYKNGQMILGASMNTYTANNLVNGDKIYARVYSYEACVTQYTTNSNTLTMQQVQEIKIPDVEVTVDQNNTCQKLTEFKAVIKNDVIIDSYEWKKNGVTVPNYPYPTRNYYREGYLTTGDQFHVVVKGSGFCVSTDPASSRNVITMNVLPSVTPKVTIKTDQWNEGSTIRSTCESKEVVFRANLTPKDPAVYNHIYQWYVNDVMAEGATGETFSILPEDDAIRKVHLVTHSYGGCLTDPYAKSGSISFRSLTPPPPVPTLVSTCGQTYLRATLVSGSQAYWQTTSNGTSMAYNGSSNYTVTQPGAYYLRSYSSSCWGAEQKIEVLPAHITPKPVLDAQPGCNDISLIPVAGVRPDDQLYYQSSATSTATNKPFTDQITSPGTYYVKGRDASGNWGCTSDPIVISQIPQGASCNRNFIRERVVQQEGITSSSQITASNAITSFNYFDGLGRPMQTVAVGASPDGKDIVTPIAYDAFGREDKKYLPYEAASGTGAYRADALDRQYDFYKKTGGTSSASVHKDNRAYAMTVFDPSPLNRVTKQGSPGSDWHPDYGRTVRFWYKTNSKNEVPLWKLTSNGANATQSYYAASTLYRRDIVDENNHKSYEYTDLQGKIVRTSRERREGVMTSVTYVYDDFDRPAYVVPDTVKVTSFAETDDVFKRFIYAYRYDERGRVREKHIPGAGWTYIVYNKLDQPVLAQDADQRTRNEWSYTKYDAHSRVVATGIFKPGSNIYGLIRDNVYNNSYTQWETRNGAGYSNTSYPTANCEELTVNFYDSYGFTAEASLAYSNGFSAHGLPTGSKVKVLDENTWLYTAIYYDKKGRVAYTASQQANGKYDKVTTEYDFYGRPIKTIRKHSAEFELATRTEYDHAGRVKKVKQNIGNGEVTVAENGYNEIGQLIRTKLHQAAGSAAPMETVDYEYNIRGWLTWIKSENYRQKLYYQYAMLESTLSKNPWNGNVSTIEWNAKGLDNNWHAFECKYDWLDRLESGSYSKSVSQGSSKRLETGYHDESYTYDIMGNIKSLKRKLGNTEIDNLTYAYTNGHRVAQVSDGSGNSLGFSGASTYTYDDAGRMTNDSQKGTVAYNHLGLVKSVTKGTDVLKYTYDATGRRVKRQFKTETARHYIDGVEYEGSVLKFVATPYGRIRKDASGVWNYDYFLKDHLGNVRVVLEAPVSSTTSNTILYMATMEESKAATEDTYFANLDETRADRPYNYPDKNLLNAKLAKVPGKSKGPSILLPVLAGDTISISAKAFYNTDKTLPGKSVDIAPVVGSAIVAMSNPVSGIVGEATQLVADLGAEASQSVALVNVPQIVDRNGEVKPQSGINFILYNSRMEVVEENTGVLLVEDKINEIQTLASDNLIMQEAGFLEVYINNEAQTPVYYDNFTVAATTGNVIEINAYYPYGMLLTALSTVAPGDEYNGYKYNGKELQDKMNLG